MPRHATGVPSNAPGWTRNELERTGFAGWVTWSTCPAALKAIPTDAGGVYIVTRPETHSPPSFLTRSPAGTFRGDPTVEPAVLESNWVGGASVVYIGKADHGQLRRRLSSFVRFGRGGSARHWGGRLIWQMGEAEQLVVAWRVLATHLAPSAEEEVLLAAFRGAYGKAPFANNPDRLGK
jgi:hypothetical protein